MRILASLIALVLVSSVAAQTPASITATGYLTDTMCGAKGATSKHIDCAKRNVASGRAQYAIYDESSRRLYILDAGTEAGGTPAVRSLIEQPAAAGQRVRITGTVSSTPITRAGQSLVPADDSGGMNPAPTTGTTMRVVTRAKALDTSTPVAGVPAISSIETVPVPR